jgi:hypothetical protein
MFHTKDENIRSQIVQIIANMWMEWTDEQKQDYIDAINSGNWEPYREKYGLGSLQYKTYDEEQELDDAVEVINLTEAEADKYMDDKIQNKDNINV